MTLRERAVLAPAPDVPAARFSLRQIPPFCGLLIAACVGMALADGYLARPAPGTHGQLLQIGALYGPAVAAGEWWRVLLGALEHGGVLHLAMNMSAVVMLGFSLERELGTWRMAAMSLVTTLGAAAITLLFAFHSPTVGASGMIVGWAGAILPGGTRRARREMTILLLQVAVISALPGVSWQGHLGGFLFGLPCGLSLRLPPGRFTLAMSVLAALAAWAAFAAAQHGGVSYRIHF